MNSQYASASAMVAYGKSAIRRRTRRPESYYDPLALCETPDDYLGVYYRNLPRDLRGDFENSLAGRANHDLYFVRIPLFILRDHRLSDLAKLMYGFIAATARSDMGSFYGNSAISKLLNRSQPQITKAIRDLKELGVIIVKYEQGKRTLRLSFSPRWEASRHGQSKKISFI